jgi:hypothetical protein
MLDRQFTSLDCYSAEVQCRCYYNSKKLAVRGQFGDSEIPLNNKRKRKRNIYTSTLQIPQL